MELTNIWGTIVYTFSKVFALWSSPCFSISGRTFSMFDLSVCFVFATVVIIFIKRLFE